MIIDDLTKLILWAGIEDYSGLWEIYWEVNAKYPLLSETEKRDALSERLRMLVNKRWVEAYWCKEPYGDLTLVDEGLVGSLLLNPLVFNEPDNHTFSLRIRTTFKGEQAFSKVYRH